MTTKKSALKQKAILEFIEKYSKEHKYPPSIREIGEAVGLRSPSTVHGHLKTLRDQGYLLKDDGKTRALSLPGRDITASGVPIIGKVTAGSPIFAFEETRGSLNYQPANSGDFFALEIKGDSMCGVGILEGDFVVVRKQNTALNGQIVVALLEDEATVKRLKLNGEEIWLIAENPTYESIYASECDILGVVESVVREKVS